jgi:cytochrome c oxidase cbb3-type subunit 1
MHPYYIARAVGGLLFLIGGCIGACNIWMTIRTPSASVEKVGDLPVPRPTSLAPAAQPAE